MWLLAALLWLRTQHAAASNSADHTHFFSPCDVVSSAVNHKKEEAQQHCSALHLRLATPRIHNLAAMISKYIALDHEALPVGGGLLKDSNVRRIYIHYNGTEGDASAGVLLEDAVDVFVIARPWWTIEPSYTRGNVVAAHVVLTRWPFLEYKLRLLVSRLHTPCS